MAHLLVPRHGDPSIPVFFNVDEAVGAAPAANRREDVLLVQFAFHVIARWPTAHTDAAVLTAARAVQVTGVIDATTIAAIRAHQDAKRRRGGVGVVIDGRVSPARGYAYGADAYWTIAHLNLSMRNRFMDLWPRIDKVPGCPAGLREMVLRTVAGTEVAA
jgi:hypothetical protein